VEATIQAAARSAQTARVYRGAIGLFLVYLSDALGAAGPLATVTYDGRRAIWAWADVPAREVLRRVTPGHVAGFRAWREAQGDGPNTASQRVAVVATFLAVGLRDGLLTPAQAATLGVKPYAQRQKRDRQPTGRRLTREEARALREAPDLSTAKGLRDRALLDILLFAALRCDEVASLTLGDIRNEGGRWRLTFAGKGSKTRRATLHDEAYASLSAWLARRGLALGTGDAAPIFVNVNKADAIGANPLNTASVNRLVSLLGARAGLAPEHGPGRLGPHDLRRTCARNAYDNGAPLPLIQGLLGHADVSTTMAYIGATDDGGAGAVDFVRY